MFQLSQKCDVHVDGLGNGHSYERRHWVINTAMIRVITKMKTRLEALRPVLIWKQNILVLSSWSVPRKHGKTSVFGWKTATKPLAASCKGVILRTRTRRRQSNRRSSRSAMSTFSSSAMHCIVRSLWPLSARNIKVIPVNTNTKVLDFFNCWRTHHHFSCVTGSPNTVFPIMSSLSASRFHGLWDFWGTQPLPMARVCCIYH